MAVRLMGRMHFLLILLLGQFFSYPSLSVASDRHLSTHIVQSCVSAGANPIEKAAVALYMGISGNAIDCNTYQWIVRKAKEIGEQSDSSSGGHAFVVFAKHFLSLPEGQRLASLSDQDFIKVFFYNLTGQSLDAKKVSYYASLNQHIRDSKADRISFIASSIVYDLMNDLRSLPGRDVVAKKTSVAICFAREDFFDDSGSNASVVSPATSANFQHVRREIASWGAQSGESVTDLIKRVIIPNRNAWPCTMSGTNGNFSCKKPEKEYETYKCIRKMVYDCVPSATTICPAPISVSKTSGFGSTVKRTSGSTTIIGIGTVQPGASNYSVQSFYWSGQHNRIYRASYTVNIANIGLVKSFILKRVLHDDAMMIKVNGQVVYHSTGGTKLDYCRNGADDGVHGCNWSYFVQGDVNRAPNKDIKPYLKEGSNTIELAVAVGLHGEGAAWFQVEGKCRDVCRIRYVYNRPECAEKGTKTCTVGLGDVGVDYRKVMPQPPGRVISVDPRQGIYEFDFGRWGDDYWCNTVKDITYPFTIKKLNGVRMFKLVKAKFDDWLGVWVNGQIVWTGPYCGTSANRLDLNGWRVCCSESVCSSRELSTSWVQGASVDLTPYLREGENTIRIKAIVGGCGEGAIKIRGQFIGEGCTYE